jgi:hypothetical protein
MGKLKKFGFIAEAKNASKLLSAHCDWRSRKKNAAVMEERHPSKQQKKYCMKNIGNYETQKESTNSSLIVKLTCNSMDALAQRTSIMTIGSPLLNVALQPITLDELTEMQTSLMPLLLIMDYPSSASPLRASLKPLKREHAKLFFTLLNWRRYMVRTKKHLLFRSPTW